MADSEFFKEVKFEVPEAPPTQPTTVVVWDKVKLGAILAEILAELDKIKGGTSAFTPRAIDPGKFGFPALNKIKLFVKDPSDKALEEVISISKQDWAATMGKHVGELLLTAREVKTDG